jgi:hypothetical protein
VVECGGLENRCSPYGEPGVRIPLSPQSQSKPSRRFCRDGFLFSDWPFKVYFDKDRMKTKEPVKRVCFGFARFPPGITTERSEVVIPLKLRSENYYLCSFENCFYTVRLLGYRHSHRKLFCSSPQQRF